MIFTIIGAGHGGQALAAYLSYKGYETILYNRTKTVIDAIKKNQGIYLEGVINTKVLDVSVTNNMYEAIEIADIIIISVPANAHESLAIEMAPYIKVNQVIILCPGRTLGAYYFEKQLRENGCEKKIIIAETDTFILTSRKIKDGYSRIVSLKKEIYISTNSKNNTEKIVGILSDPFPMIKCSSSYIYTSLSNVGAIFHPVPALLNIGRIENKHSYAHYKEGITPSICNLIQKLDDERVALAKKLGENIPTAMQWLEIVYGSKGNTLYEAIQNTIQYNDVYAPTEISTRYIYEDITTGIVPMYYLADLVGSENTICRLVIEMATQILDYDFIENGRNDVENFVKQMEISRIDGRRNYEINSSN